MGEIRGMVDEDFSGRDWNLATAMVINGEAAMQIMGDWAKGEREIFEAAGHREGDALDSDFFPRLWTAERPAPEPT